MSNVSKRVIYVGPADGSDRKPLNYEGNALAASILPGTIMQVVANGLQANTAASTVFGQVPLVADKNQQQTRSVDDAWTQNENMVAIQPRSGEFLNVLVADGNNLSTPLLALTRNGSGKLKIAATNGTDEIVAYSDEIVNVSGSDALVRVRFV